MNRYVLLFFFKLSYCLSIQTLPKLTIDDFLNTSYYPSISLSPSGQYLLVHSRRPAWNMNRYNNTLWLYETEGGRKKLITNQLSNNVQAKWSSCSNWIAYFTDENSQENVTDNYRGSGKLKPKQYLRLYNIMSDEKVFIDVGTDNPLAITWGSDDGSLYLVSISSPKVKNSSYEAEWKDVIRYRDRKSTDGASLYRINIHRKKTKISVEIMTVKHLDFLVGELLFVPVENKLVFTSASPLLENADVFEIYSIDLSNVSTLSRLTSNEGIEENLQLSTDGKRLFFLVYSLSPSNGQYNNTQNRLYSIDLKNGMIERWGKDFNGNIIEYAIRPEGGVYILGQLGINVQIYLQQSSSKYSILQYGWSGSYRQISSSTASSSIAFVHSSFERPQEVYFINHINQLYLPKVITCENQLLTQRNLPQTKVYRWINNEDDRTIEGILHYPPGKFGCKNLPLFVLIHGGPTDASLNMLQANWYSWAPLAASHDWLVFEPNYRGSTGYGDDFLNEIRNQFLSRPGRDILAGVNCLIRDGIADPNRLTVGGYSYGGYLTNWLITQTKMFNAALSGAAPVEHIAFWGRMDYPAYIEALIGGFPWKVPHIYYNESIMYKLDKVRTSTHIITGANDVRVPYDQSLILERGLHYLGVPVKLLLFPEEGHSLGNNPWHGKIKIREELAWLEKYGHTSLI